MPPYLKRITPDQVPAVRRDPVEPKARATAEPIVDAVRTQGMSALRRYATQFGELADDNQPIIIRPDALKKAYDSLDNHTRECLERTARRIEKFALSQKASATEMTVPIPGGEAGHTLAPVEAAGCYAPGGRYPLPSTVLMTAVTARVAGCSRVVVASPRPSPVTLAAAHVARADYLLPVGGAHAIAALAYGAGDELQPCDAVVGPGNMYVTAAKSLVAGRVAIDMLAGPSECLVVADETASASIVAADLLAQAEHDPSALPALICLSDAFADAVDQEIGSQLAKLATRETAEQALRNGYVVVVPTIDEAAAISDRLAVEHVELHVADAMGLARRLKHYGGLFVGELAAEVLGDYGAGPNHTLPTGGTARSYGGLSVFTFLRTRTWMRVDSRDAASQMVADAEMLGKLEGLMGHAASAAQRLPPSAKVCEPGIERSVSTQSWDTTAKRLHFAVPKKGRIHEKVLKFLEAAGLEYDRPERLDIAQVRNLPITLVFLPAADIAAYVGEGNVDLGITGEDIIAESRVQVVTELELGFGKCALSLLVPVAQAGASVADYAGARIVTSFEAVTEQFFRPLDAAAGKETAIKYVSGSVEAACKLGLADAVVDLVETGTTMRAAGLCELAQIMTSQAVLISNPSTRHGELVAKITSRFRGYLDSIKYQLISYNASREILAQCLEITPGKKSPNITPLSSDGWVAVSAMIPKKEAAERADKLIAVGATDILVFNIQDCRV